MPSRQFELSELFFGRPVKNTPKASRLYKRIAAKPITVIIEIQPVIWDCIAVGKNGLASSNPDTPTNVSATKTFRTIVCMRSSAGSDANRTTSP